MNVSLVSLIYFFGAIQAIVLIIGINIRKPFYSDLKKITTLLLLVIVTVLTYYTIILNKIMAAIPVVNLLGSASWMAIAPSFYLMCLCLQKPKWTLKRKHIVFFFCSFLFLAESLFSIIEVNIWNGLVETQSQYLDLWMLLFFGSGLFFMVKSLAIFRSNEEKERNRGLKWFVQVFLFLLVAYGIAFIFVRNNYAKTFELSMIAFIEVFVFSLVYKVFKLLPFQHFFDLNKYSSSAFSKKKLSVLAQQLEKVMDYDKPFLDKKLDLNKLADLSKISSNDLSQLFSLHYRSNFYEYINRYRIDHFEDMVQNSDYQQYKIIALAEESGFKSKATFYKAFKDKHELTPAQFIKKFKQHG